MPLLDWFSRARYVFDTVRHLKATQIFHQIRQRVESAPKIDRSLPLSNRQLGPFQAFLRSECVTFDGSWHFRFLNSEAVFPFDGIDWRSERMPKLWRYNLHYLDCLACDRINLEQKASIIESWIAGNPIGSPDAWEPYTLSLRIVNLVKHFASLPSIRLPQHWQVSLVHQVRWLDRRLEYHLLANHLFKNAVALMFAGVWFGGCEGDRWFRRGCALLSTELAEQFLNDGGHFERSPMYHALCLVDCLDVLNLLSGAPDLEANRLRETLVTVVLGALRFLRKMSLADGKIALFNDSAHGIAPQLAEIEEYAIRVTGLDAAPDIASNFDPINLEQSGYFGFRDGAEGLIVDCGPVGPSYQPGHAHCDTLSFEWVLDGRRIIVDSGTFDYEPGLRRQYSRSTRGHNVVMVDGAEQSEIWGVFRVARRANAKLIHFEAENGRFVFEGAHDGYVRLKGGVYVRRRITREDAGCLLVEDKVEGRGIHSVESFLHFGPDFRIDLQDKSASVIAEDGIPLAIVELIDCSKVDLLSGEYYPEFGIARQNEGLRFRAEGILPISFRYRLRKF